MQDLPGSPFLLRVFYEHAPDGAATAAYTSLAIASRIEAAMRDVAASQIGVAWSDLGPDPFRTA